MISKLIALFVLGFSFATFGDSLLINNQLTFNPLNNSGWIATSSGFGGLFIGLLYPFIDYIFNTGAVKTIDSKKIDKQGWIKTIRCWQYNNLEQST